MATTELSKIITAELFVPTSPYEISKIYKRKEIDPFVERAANLIINDEEDRQIGVNLGQILVVAAKEIKENYEPYKQSITAIHKQILIDENYELDRIKAAKDALSKQILFFEFEQNKKRQEEEAKARLEAQKAEEERRIAEAIQLEAEGNNEEANQVLSEESLPLPAITQKAPKVKGQVNKTKWYAEVTDKKKLIQAVADGLIPMEALEINQSFLDNQARQFRKGLNYAGVEAREKSSVQFRS